jgi:hypothetical protein
MRREYSVSRRGVPRGRGRIAPRAKRPFIHAVWFLEFAVRIFHRERPLPFTLKA